MSESRYVYYASAAGAALNSDVRQGGGDDDTAAIQRILDMAPSLGSLHLYVDGAARVSGLRVHSNTTIECLNPDCGFFQGDRSNLPIVCNSELDHEVIHNHSIALIGGTYNQNCAHQLHDVPADSDKDLVKGWVMPFKFFGVENLLLRDVTIRDQSTFALLCSNFYNVTMENINIELPGHEDARNQDGLHFWGPGRFLTLRNIKGRSGDDFIALAPDERDEKSDITDVLIDGVTLDYADQAIRLLSRGRGKLDRVIIKNIIGTYRSFGFWINPWFRRNIDGSYNRTGGNFGSIIIDTVNLKPMDANYHYVSPFLFSVGGTIEHLTLRNIYMQGSGDKRRIADIGIPFTKMPESVTRAEASSIGSVLIDGLHIEESNPDAADTNYITVRCPVRNLTIRDAEVLRGESMPKKGAFLELCDECDIKTLFIHDVQAERLDTFIKSDIPAEKRVKNMRINNVFLSEVESGEDFERGK